MECKNRPEMDPDSQSLMQLADAAGKEQFYYFYFNILKVHMAEGQARTRQGRGYNHKYWNIIYTNIIVGCHLLLSTLMLPGQQYCVC